MPTEEIKKILNQRSSNYGLYGYNMKFRSKMLDAVKECYFNTHGKEMDSQTFIYFDDLAMKVARLAVTPDHLDTLRDIIGYTTLYLDILTGNHYPKSKQK